MGREEPVFIRHDITPMIVNMVQSVLPAFREIRPTRAKIEFGLSFRTDGPIITSGVDNCNMRITLEWDSEKE